ncbi:STAS domain-containing protein [Bacillus sp. C11]|nr:STAS domain-containing protein [Neobacillus terrae]
MEYLKNGQFPHSTNITLFQRFKSNIVVNTLTSETGEKLGYILTWKDLTEFENAIQERNEQIKELESPIIPLANDTSVLVPLLGKITGDRINHIESKVLKYCVNHQINDVLFDLSEVNEGITPETATRLQQMQTALSLMGVEPIYVGIKPEFAQSIVRDGIFIGAKTFTSYKQGVFYVWKKSGYPLQKVRDR